MKNKSLDVDLSFLFRRKTRAENQGVSIGSEGVMARSKHVLENRLCWEDDGGKIIETDPSISSQDLELLSLDNSYSESIIIPSDTELKDILKP